MEIPLARPDITDAEIEAVVEVLKTSYLALGPKLKEFENAIAEYAGVRYAVAVNSGTSALHLIIRALGIGEGDEVITTPFSFVSSSNCILFERAKPVFIDIDPKTLNIDPELIEAAITPRTKAILAVDVFGHPAEWDRLKEIADKHGLRLIEDSAEALGAEYNSHESRVKSDEPKTSNQSAQTRHQWKKAGSLGDAAVFAFYPNKQITTGEGGVVLTDDEKVATLCRSLRNQGRGEGSTWLAHERLGYNYRLSDINCTLGIAQLERIDEIIAARDQVANWYATALPEIEGVEAPYVAPNVRMSWFVYVVQLSEAFTQKDRDRILQGLQEKGIGCRNYFAPIHLQPFYREILGTKEGDFPITEHVGERTIALPFHNNLTKGEIDYVVENLDDILRSIA
jgi:perosamine synthetase